ncbi:MAG: thiosulfate oxidation carrier complex protein SoxZ [Epsilonproteobacteria bacterium]|nr:thiosulfate oxidation carrier complex protein SoxZ [Campylobacterota bacterium]
MGIKSIAKVKNDIATVKLLVKHPMLSGTISGGKGKPKYITHLTVKHGGRVVYDMYPTSAISKNPYIKFAFKGAKKGDIITVQWKDNTGATEKKDIKLK